MSSEPELQALREENQHLKKVLESYRRRDRAAFTGAAGIGALLLAGPRLYSATRSTWDAWSRWLRDPSRSLELWPESETRDFVAALLTRLLRTVTLAALATTLPLIILTAQTFLLSRQTRLLALQNDRISQQNSLLTAQNRVMQRQLESSVAPSLTIDTTFHKGKGGKFIISLVNNGFSSVSNVAIYENLFEGSRGVSLDPAPSPILLSAHFVRTLPSLRISKIAPGTSANFPVDVTYALEKMDGKNYRLLRLRIDYQRPADGARFSFVKGYIIAGSGDLLIDVESEGSKDMADHLYLRKALLQ